jgi:hypothetical protein
MNLVAMARKRLQFSEYRMEFRHGAFLICKGDACMRRGAHCSRYFVGGWVVYSIRLEDFASHAHLSLAPIPKLFELMW